MHELFNFGNSLFKTVLARARNMEVQRGILRDNVLERIHAIALSMTKTYSSTGHAFIRVIVASGRDIL